MQCKNCKFWKRNLSALGIHGDDGQCRRRAPTRVGLDHETKQMLRLIAESAVKSSGLTADHEPAVDEEASASIGAIFNHDDEPVKWPFTWDDDGCGDGEGAS